MKPTMKSVNIQIARNVMDNMCIQNTEEGFAMPAFTNIGNPSVKTTIRSIERISKEQLDEIVQEYRSYLCEAALSTVWFAVLWNPIFSGSLEQKQTEKFRMYTAAITLLESLTIQEFAGLFRDDENEITHVVEELANKYSLDTPLGDRAMSILLESDGDVWEEFIMGLFEVAAYMAKIAGAPNKYNDFRLSINCPSYWDKE